ncbi:MAG: hypothetical protein HY049_04595 [Acidobacteria bacterium]|nr:hypothetical protein [Acidobacteriota bacterium]
MKKILPGIHTWSHYSTQKRMDFNGWCLPGKDGTVLVDPPPADRRTMTAIEKLGPVRAIILTNKDHVRACDELAGHFRAPVLIHQADAPLVTLRIGGLFLDGEKLPGGLEVIHVSGAKSPGECALLFPPAKALILGDALIGKPKGKLSMLPEEKFPDPSKAVEGIRALLDYPFDAVLVGDGAPILKGGRKAIEDFLKRCLATSR